MKELKLVKATEEYSEQIKSYRAEFLENGDSMDGTSNLRKYEEPSDWLAWVTKMGSKETCSDNWVPATQFLCIRISDNKLVGMIDMRHELNEYCFNYAGHIGYSIRKSERRKGYATEMLALCITECKIFGLCKVLITCDKNNIASAKTMIKNGAILENEVPEENEITQRYWVVL